MQLTPRTLRFLNLGVFVLQALCGAAILGITDKDNKLPWYTDFADLDRTEDLPNGEEARNPLFYVPISKKVANIPIGILAGIFLLLSAMDHLIVALPFFNGIYNRGLARNINIFRWIEYSISAAIMHVMIAQLSGVSEVHLLYAIFGLSSTTMFHGWMMERYNSTAIPTYTLAERNSDPPMVNLDGEGAQFISDVPSGAKPKSTSAKVDWVPFYLGFIPHLFVWSIIACYFFTGVSRGDPPGFVWAIIFILFFIDLAFALNQFLQFLQVPGWRGFAMGEFWYIILSVSAKQLLAWINYGGTRRFSD